MSAKKVPGYRDATREIDEILRRIDDADEIDVDVAGRLQIGKPAAPYSSGIYGGPKDPRLVDVTAGELFMYGTGGIVLQKEGIAAVYG